MPSRSAQRYVPCIETLEERLAPAAVAQLTLVPFSTGYNHPIGIAPLPGHSLVVSDNYPTGQANVLEKAAADGSHAPFRAATGHSD